MLQNLFSIRQFRLTKWSFLVHSTTHNAPHIHPSHNLIPELWQTFPNATHGDTRTIQQNREKEALIKGRIHFGLCFHPNFMTL